VGGKREEGGGGAWGGGGGKIGGRGRGGVKGRWRGKSDPKLYLPSAKSLLRQEKRVFAEEEAEIERPSAKRQERLSAEQEKSGTLTHSKKKRLRPGGVWGKKKRTTLED